MTTALTKNLVSVRLAPEITDAVSEYAEANRLTKTAAYETFLRKGLEAHLNPSQEEDQRSINEKLDQVLKILTQGNAPEVLGLPEVGRIVSEVSAGFPAIKRALVFGSFARSTQNSESDIDLRVEIDRTTPFNLRDLNQFAKRIEQETGREVDIISSTEIKNAQLKKAIEDEGVLVYER